MFSRGFRFGDCFSCTIDRRTGDLLARVDLQIELPDLPRGCAWVNSIGHALIKKITLEVGGQTIDEQCGAWLEICSELMLTSAQREGYRRMVHSKDWLFVPLRFWFCTDPGSPLPIIAMRFHEVKLHVELSALAGCVVSASPLPILAFKSFSVIANYVFLDPEERKRFADLKVDYLITQTQKRTSPVVFDGKAHKIDIGFDHPVKELVFTLKREGASSLEWTDSLVSAAIIMNGHERERQPAGYFRLVQPYRHHKRVPTAHIYVYSFAMRPEESQPSGACNFTRIDSAKLELILKNHGGELGEVCVYAVNYNTLKVRNGLAGTSYASYSN